MPSFQRNASYRTAKKAKRIHIIPFQKSNIPNKMNEDRKKAFNGIRYLRSGCTLFWRQHRLERGGADRPTAARGIPLNRVLFLLLSLTSVATHTSGRQRNTHTNAKTQLFIYLNLFEELHLFYKEMLIYEEQPGRKSKVIICVPYENCLIHKTFK